jgi:fructose-bisphosphate aldolase class 1
MNLAELNKVAEAMVAPGRGILAADESTGTIKKRFDAIGVESTTDNRRDYREMLFRSSEAMSKCISGVILYDETIRQKAKDGTPLVKLIENAGTIPGIKVDKGAKPLPFCPGELITEGLDGLRERLVEYRGLGAKFAKWRAVIDIGPGIPSYAAIMTNANALGRYAALCQEEGIVPIVEPEVLMDGDHDADRCYVITEWVLKTVFEQLYYQKVALEGMVREERKRRWGPARLHPPRHDEQPGDARAVEAGSREEGCLRTPLFVGAPRWCADSLAEVLLADHCAHAKPRRRNRPAVIFAPHKPPGLLPSRSIEAL